MKPINVAELLCIWEEGLSQPVLVKTLRLLGTAYHINDYTALAKLSIGQRDIMLLKLRQVFFGKRLNNVVACPHCGEKVEWESNTEDYFLQEIPSSLTVRTINFSQESYAAKFRLPDSNDMMTLMEQVPALPDHKTIIKNCILEASFNGKLIKSTELPDNIYVAIDEKMSTEDPQADIDIQLHCPLCNHEWEAKFDILSFLWAEINNWARQLLMDVYQLAKAFGWSEQEILNMSAERRNIYLQMISA